MKPWSFLQNGKLIWLSKWIFLNKNNINRHKKKACIPVCYFSSSGKILEIAIFHSKYKIKNKNSLMHIK